MAEKARVKISCDADTVIARQKGKEVASKIGFPKSDLTLIATAISELARNIIEYAKQGEITIELKEISTKEGVSIAARDEGPGIPDIDQAIQDGFSTSNGLGLGLPGVKRLMDEFEVDSEVGKGTTVTVKKWKR